MTSINQEKAKERLNIGMALMLAGLGMVIFAIFILPAALAVLVGLVAVFGG